MPRPRRRRPASLLLEEGSRIALRRPRRRRRSSSLLPQRRLQARRRAVLRVWRQRAYARLLQGSSVQARGRRRRRRRDRDRRQRAQPIAKGQCSCTKVAHSVIMQRVCFVPRPSIHATCLPIKYLPDRYVDYCTYCFQLFLQISRLIQCRVDIAEASRTIPSHFHHRQRFHQPSHRRIVIDIFRTIFRLGFRAICTPMLAA